MDFIIENLGDILAVASSVIAIAAIIAKYTPNTWDNKVVQFLRNLIDWLAQNSKHAENLPDKHKKK